MREKFFKYNYNHAVSICLILALIVFSAQASLAQTNQFTYQGRLTDGGVAPTGSYDLQFELFDAQAGGSQQGGTIVLSSVAVSGGIFTVNLNFGPQFDGNARFLQISVKGAGSPSPFAVLNPRQSISSAPYAIRSLTAANADSATTANTANTATNAAQLNGQGASFYQNAANLNAGTLNLAQLPNPLNLTGTADFSGIFKGTNTSTNGYGVYGQASAASGTAIGGYFESSSTTGFGVFGNASASSGANTGVYGLNLSTNGKGVYGLANASTGSNYGGYFQTNSSSGRGVVGIATSTGGVTVGGRFESDSSSGYAVEAEATSAFGTTYGVFGRSVSTSGRGVLGQALASSGSTYGVYGDTHAVNASAYAVFANGRSGASGTKSFRIDHPSDPENKYLLHYSAESPEVINFYRGTITLDANGESMVELPAYFASINKDPSYTLTAVGAAMPMLHVSKEISETALKAGEKAAPGGAVPACFFRIAGGLPGGKVSWRVEALRNDRWMRNNRTPVEADKQDMEKGTYQHPEFYGQPKERGMNYSAPRDEPMKEKTKPPLK